ncbi:lytic polysaccharide monooxygenase auxiliary activity family 9 protein [Pseudomonas sp. LB3P25]
MEGSINAMTSKNVIPDLLDQLGKVTETVREISRTETIKPLHGRISTPESRAQFLYNEGKLNLGQLVELECGKGFPALIGDLPDADAPADVRSAVPPPDGMIASGGYSDERALLNAAETGNHWKKHNVVSGQEFTLTWEYRQTHRTRRWKYYLTKPDWNAQEPLARKHFEEAPIQTYLNTFQPYWAPGNEVLYPPIIHQHKMTLPVRSGYHVLLAVWDVADTQNAFYQVLDLNFTS